MLKEFHFSSVFINHAHAYLSDLWQIAKANTNSVCLGVVGVELFRHRKSNGRFLFSRCLLSDTELEVSW